MADFNVDSQHRHHQFNTEDQEKGNISIKQKMGIHNTHGIVQKDAIEASSSSYHEEYVPPVDSPVLEASDPNASNDPPKKSTRQSKC